MLLTSHCHFAPAPLDLFLGQLRALVHSRHAAFHFLATGFSNGRGGVLSSMSAVQRIVQRSWRDRVHYSRRRDWLLSIYNRMLLHLPSVPLAGRRRERLV